MGEERDEIGRMFDVVFKELKKWEYYSKENQKEIIDNMRNKEINKKRK